MKRAEPGWLVLALAGIAAAIGSSLPFYTFGGDIELTVWHRTLFPTATLIPVLLFAFGLEALFVLLMGREPRSPFLNFTWSQARLAGSAFAIVLALCYLVQGRAGGSLGTGYLIMSLSALAAFGGAVLTRRAELARRPEEVVAVEHPWRAAILRWRRDLAAKAQAYANGASTGAPRVQPVSDPPIAATTEDAEKEGAAKTPEKSTPAPRPVPRLSAVQSAPETEDKTEAKTDQGIEEKTEQKTKEKKPTPAEQKRAKQAAKKTVPQIGGESVGDASPANDGEAQPEPEATGEAEAQPDANAGAEAEATPEAKADAGTEVDAEAEAELQDDERERPAAPG
ncbi:MAG TPA: hypothetical protein VEM59_11395 [Acidimicrobiia bacterium]|nr:hypothetical protein [Acidimicrobiia bacterium]